jgi:hypothetical protein
MTSSGSQADVLRAQLEVARRSCLPELVGLRTPLGTIAHGAELR